MPFAVIKKIIFLTLLGSTQVLLQSASAAQTDYRRLIIFGDSYSDNGNVFRITNGQTPNAIRYFLGRFTNGLTWGEYFADYLKIPSDDPHRFIDFAYGGAAVSRPVRESLRGHPKEYYIIPNLSGQIDEYIKKYNKFNFNDLVIVFIGTNDFTPDIHTHNRKRFQSLADQEAEQVNRLQKSGAKDVIIFTVRNIAYSPMIRRYKKKHIYSLDWAIDQVSSYIIKYIQIFNERLIADLGNKPGIFIYDIFNFDNNIFSQIKQGGFNYVMDNHPYVIKNLLSTCYGNYIGDYQDAVDRVCQNPQEYFFYDRIHTTSAVNYLLAKDVFLKFRNHSRERR